MVYRISDEYDYEQDPKAFNICIQGSFRGGKKVNLSSVADDKEVNVMLQIVGH